MANSLTTEELISIIKGGETSRVEFKVAMPRQSEMAERICGLANAQGGYIILGVEDGSLQIVGVGDTGGAVDGLLRAARQIQPSLSFTPTEPEIYELEGKKVVVATVTASVGPVYQASGVFWIRRGSHTIPMSYSEIRDLGNERGADSWEELPGRKATMADLDMERVKQFLALRPPRRQLLNRLDEIEQVLAALGGATRDSGGEWRPTNAGLLFFGYSPQINIPQSEVVCVLFKNTSGTGGYTDRRILYGTITELIDGAEIFLNDHLVTGAKIEGWKRLDVPEYPVEALREAVVNAIVHRDYSKTGEVIRIFKYPDRLEIRSPGLLLPGITLQQMEEGTVSSRLRNLKLGNLLRDVPGYFERIGSGIRFMLEETRRLEMPAPEFREVGEVVVTFRPNPNLAAIDNIVNLPEGRLEEKDEQTRRQTLAMKYLRQHGSITTGEYIKLTGASDRTALRDLNDLVQQGAIRRIGQKRASRYVL